MHANVDRPYRLLTHAIDVDISYENGHALPHRLHISQKSNVSGFSSERYQDGKRGLHLRKSAIRIQRRAHQNGAPRLI